MKNQCDYCLFQDYDIEMDVYYCTMNIDQDDAAKTYFSRTKGCPYFKMGDDYTIIRKQK